MTTTSATAPDRLAAVPAVRRRADRVVELEQRRRALQDLDVVAEPVGLEPDRRRRAGPAGVEGAQPLRLQPRDLGGLVVDDVADVAEAGPAAQRLLQRRRLRTVDL